MEEIKIDDFSSLLYERLRGELDVVKTTSSGDEIMIRCVYCGDSIKNQYSAHFYIQSSFPYLCYCQRCSVKSVVSVSMLNDFGITDRHLKMETMKIEKDRKFNLGDMNRKNSNSFVDSVLKDSNDFEIPDTVGSETELVKVLYLNKRLGLNLGLEDMKDLNVITNFGLFLDENDIKLNPRMNEITFENLHYNSIGFLSQDKNFIVFRSMDPNITGFRYYNYNLTGKRENARKYYTIPQDIDILDPDITIVVTEGIFDLLSVYFNVYGGEPKKHFKGNVVFVSTNGIGMNLVINTVSKLGFLNPNVYIFSDSEVGLNFYRNIKNKSMFLQNSRLKVHYNQIEGDFGVPKDKIDMSYVYV